MNKRGQFFLIAALVVIGIIIGLSIAYTTVKTPREETRVFDLSNEIYYEGAQVIDTGILNTDYSGNIQNDIDELIGNYSALYPDSKITVVYGTSATTYTCSPTGTIGFSNTGVSTCKLNKESTTTTKSDDNKVEVWLGEETYEFELNPGQNFFVVIRKESAGGEQIVAT